MSNKPIVPTYTDRIDYDGITKRFEAIKKQAKTASTIVEFATFVSKPCGDTFSEYYHLVSDENYRPGELATMISHCIDCINAIAPKHLSCVCVVSPSRRVLLFLPKDRVRGTPSLPN